MNRVSLVRAAALVVLALSGMRVNGAAAQLFRGPVTCSSCISDFYYIDQGLGRDWNCGNSSYSGHTGSDYSLRNGNAAIDGNAEVVAMATGVVVHAEDGYYDRCRQCGGANCGRGFGNGFANQVIINHGLYRVIYGHMKLGSIAVQEGDVVECGQVIGFIGSSGCSTGAHLHIEPSLAADFRVRPYTPIEPYAGDCSPTEPSLFVDQGAYRTLPSATCDGAPQVPACPPNTYDIWTCTEDGSARRRCLDGVVTDDACGWGCTAMPFGTDDVCALPPDADADGSRADVDCDDDDAAVHPGAVEVCGDGIDQNCSGADTECPPPPAAGMGGMGGTEPAPPVQAGAAAPVGSAGQTAPPFGPGGEPAPPLPQAGASDGPQSWPLPSARNEQQSSGCGIVAPGRRLPRSDLLALSMLALLAIYSRGRRRRRKSACSARPMLRAG